jgi:hypothetical protein
MGAWISEASKNRPVFAGTPLALVIRVVGL